MAKCYFSYLCNCIATINFILSICIKLGIKLALALYDTIYLYTNTHARKHTFEIIFKRKRKVGEKKRQNRTYHHGINSNPLAYYICQLKRREKECNKQKFSASCALCINIENKLK